MKAAQYVVRVGGVVGWVLVGVDAWVPGMTWLLDFDQSRWLAVTAAVCGITWIGQRLQMPVGDVWEAGRAQGRREALKDFNVRAVVELADVRRQREEEDEANAASEARAVRETSGGSGRGGR